MNQIEEKFKCTDVWRLDDYSVTYGGDESQNWFFDYVFDPALGTQSIYDAMAFGIVMATLEGWNGTVFAYGQTSSGKTHTLMGSKEEPGIIVLSVHDVFKSIASSPGTEFLVRVSYLEIYNEEIKDLFYPEETNLRVYDDAKKGPLVKNLQEVVVCSPNEVLALLADGEKNRSVAATNMNARSSRR
jgi:centromeric protein E